jgi:hypothetical protein
MVPYHQPPNSLPRPIAPLPLRPYKRVPQQPLSSPLLPHPSFPSIRALSEPALSAPPPLPSPPSRRRSITSRALVIPGARPPCPTPPPRLSPLSASEPERPEAELRWVCRHARGHTVAVHRGPRLNMVHGPWTESTGFFSQK